MILLVIFSLSSVQCYHDVSLVPYTMTFVFCVLIIFPLEFLTSCTSSYAYPSVPLTRSLRPPPPIRMTAAIDRTTRRSLQTTTRCPPPRSSLGRKMLSCQTTTIYSRYTTHHVLQRAHTTHHALQRAHTSHTTHNHTSFSYLTLSCLFFSHSLPPHNPLPLPLPADRGDVERQKREPNKHRHHSARTIHNQVRTCLLYLRI
jgi:hypothetical protein